MSLGVTLGTLLIQVFEPFLNNKNNVVSFSVIRCMSCCCMTTFNVHMTDFFLGKQKSEKKHMPISSVHTHTLHEGTIPTEAFSKSLLLV